MRRRSSTGGEPAKAQRRKTVAHKGRIAPKTVRPHPAVEDSGTGIDPKDLDVILEPFFTTKSNRMGMGLSICWSIIANHGGRLAVAHGEPHGSILQVFYRSENAKPTS